MDYTATALYGVPAAVQPSGAPGPQPNPEITSPISTAPIPGRTRVTSQPTFWIVIIVAVAIGLVHVSIRFS